MTAGQYDVFAARLYGGCYKGWSASSPARLMQAPLTMRDSSSSTAVSSSFSRDASRAAALFSGMAGAGS